MPFGIASLHNDIAGRLHRKKNNISPRHMRVYYVTMTKRKIYLIASLSIHMPIYNMHILIYYMYNIREYVYTYRNGIIVPILKGGSCRIDPLISHQNGESPNDCNDHALILNFFSGTIPRSVRG